MNEADSPRDGCLGSHEHTGEMEGETVAPLEKLEKPVPQIEGPWIYPRNLWILVRYRIPTALTYGLRGERP